MASSRTTAHKTRERRTPEASRALILDAATVVLAALGPDRAGLKDIAKEAGVSHALVTHYFGTFDALVEQVLGARMAELRETVLAAIVERGPRLRIEDLIRIGLTAIRDPVTSRLMAWAFLTRRLDDASFFAYERRGLRAIVDALAAHPDLRATGITRSELERRVVIIWSAVLSYSVTAPVLWVALGRNHTSRRDAAIEAELVRFATAPAPR